jgi:RNA polymerase-interacting CarD/CdnL/TRCF family regulator
MDAKAEMVKRLLKGLEADVKDLAEIVRDLPRMDAGERLMHHNDWMQMIVEDIEALNEAAANGTLDASERRRYETVRNLLNNSEDALRLLDVPTLKESEALPSGQQVPA